MRTICLGLGSSGVARLLLLDVAHLEALEAVEVQQPVVAVVEIEDVLEIVEREVVLEHAEGTLEAVVDEDALESTDLVLEIVDVGLETTNVEYETDGARFFECSREERDTKFAKSFEGGMDMKT